MKYNKYTKAVQDNMIKLLEEKMDLLERKAKYETACEEDLTQLHSLSDEPLPT